MTIKDQEKRKISHTGELPKYEINLQYRLYMFSFFIIYYISFIFPGILIVWYIFIFYIPFFLEADSIILIFTQLEPLLASVFMPVMLILCYLLHLFLVGIATKWLWGITEKISPSKEGNIPRNVPSKALDFYHIRSFMIKYGKNAFQKGPYPWLINWFYNLVGSNKIGKGSTLEEQFGADKFVNIGKNSYIGVNSGFSSHSLEGIFGRISYFKINIGDNVTTGGINCVAPGVNIKDDSYLFPLASATKFSDLKGDNYYFGVPLRKIFKKKITNYLNISLEDLEKADNLKIKKRGVDPS